MILTAEATNMLGRKITLTYTHETGEIRLRDDKSTLHLSGIIGFTGKGSENDADYVRRKVTGSKTAKPTRCKPQQDQPLLLEVRERGYGRRHCWAIIPPWKSQTNTKQ